MVLAYFNSRYDTDLFGDYRILNLNKPIAAKRNQKIKMRIVGASIPVSFYTINNSNNLISITESLRDGSSPYGHNITLTNGNPNIYQLAADLETQLNDNTQNSTVYSVSADSTRFTLLIEIITVNRKLVISASSTTMILGISGDDLTATDLIIGESEYPVDLNTIIAVYIRTKMFNVRGTLTNRASDSILLRKNVDVDNFSIMQVEQPNALFQELDVIELSNIVFSIETYDKTIINFNNSDYEIVFEIVVE